MKRDRPSVAVPFHFGNREQCGFNADPRSSSHYSSSLFTSQQRLLKRLPLSAKSEDFLQGMIVSETIASDGRARNDWNVNWLIVQTDATR